ncbi:uncharacterized protein [Nicotiana sylvestris]|uniref:uncharacterized protein n=1 Tax=Nicotiana sylvestris TaxID=4096 RepID=UPI00388C981B
MDKQSGRFLEVLNQVYINLPFTKVLSQISTYVKFLKEILSNKRKVKETLVAKLTEHCSTILQNKLPQKCVDSGIFPIPYSLGSINFEKSLSDSCVSINLIPLSIFRSLEKEIGEIRYVYVSLQLTDQTRIIPKK